MINRLYGWFCIQDEIKWFRLWLLFFTYTALISLFIQLVAIPYLFPSWNAGDGLLKGYDFFRFHQLATSMAEKIHAQGWSAWQLRPEGQAPAGIAAIFYVLFIPKPWVLIPLSAALHATAVLFLIKILHLFIPNKKAVIFAALPFWLYPSAATWYAQIHKDGYFIAGFLMFVYGWNLLLQSKTLLWARQIVWATLLMTGGVILVWIVRPYAIQMMQGLSAVAGVFTLVLLIERSLKGMVNWPQAILAAILLGLVVAGSSLLRRLASAEAEVEGTLSSSALHKVVWKDTFWPGFIEEPAHRLANTREGYLLAAPQAGSNVDLNVSFHQVNDLIFYLPRAAELGFLAPFPADWFQQGTQESTTMERRIAGLETIGIYIGLSLLPIAFWRWRRSPEFWLTAFFSTGMLLIYALVVANIGTLYRFRYGFIMTLVAIGLAAGITTFQEWDTKRKV